MVFIRLTYGYLRGVCLDDLRVILTYIDQFCKDYPSTTNYHENNSPLNT